VSILRYSMWKKYRDIEIPVRGQSRSLNVVPFDILDMVSFYSNFVAKTHRFFSRYSTSKVPWPWKPGYGSVKVIEYVKIDIFNDLDGPLGVTFTGTSQYFKMGKWQQLKIKLGQVLCDDSIASSSWSSQSPFLLHVLTSSESTTSLF